MSAKIATPLSRKAVLVALNISEWSGFKRDKEATQDVHDKHGAADDAGAYNKRLLAKHHLAEIKSLRGKARDVHYSMTHPWSNEGPRILANVLFDKFMAELRGIKREFDEAADRFAAGFARFVEERRATLGSLFNPADYPSADEIRERFSFDVKVMPMPEADDFRSELDADTVDQIKAELAATQAKVIDGTVANNAQKIAKVVGHMVERLNAYKPSGGKGDKAEGIFRDSLVENMRELADLLPALNLTNDPRIASLTDRIVKELCAEDAEALRQNDAARASVAKSADDILAEVSTLFG